MYEKRLSFFWLTFVFVVTTISCHIPFWEAYIFFFDLMRWHKRDIMGCVSERRPFFGDWVLFFITSKDLLFTKESVSALMDAH